MKIVKYKLVVTMLLSLTISAIASEDTQVWNNNSFKFKLNDTWNFSVNEELRYSDSASKLLYFHYDMGVSSDKIIDGVELGINYRYIKARKTDGDWKRSHAPHVNFTFKDILELPISNRSRFQFYDNEEEFDDFWIYRNQTKLKLDNVFGIESLTPYVSDEFFVRLDGPTEINRNRLSFGMSYKLNKSMSIKCFYMWQTTSVYNEWIDIDVIGFDVLFKF